MMTIVKGHLCKSNPFDAANFGLIATGALDTFHGNLSVHLSGVKGRPRSTPICVPPPQARVSTLGFATALFKFLP